MYYLLKNILKVRMGATRLMVHFKRYTKVVISRIKFEIFKNFLLSVLTSHINEYEIAHNSFSSDMTFACFKASFLSNCGETCGPFSQNASQILIFLERLSLVMIISLSREMLILLSASFVVRKPSFQKTPGTT